MRVCICLGTQWNGSLELMSLLNGNCARRHGATSAVQEHTIMKKDRDLNAVQSDLQGCCRRGDIDPEQQKDVEAAIEVIKRIRRKSQLSRAEAHAAIREIASKLVQAFLRKNP